MADICPGELVVRKIRWHQDSTLIGVVIGHDDAVMRSWLVMWTRENQVVDFKWHLTEALLIVEAENINELRQRCRLAT